MKFFIRAVISVMESDLKIFFNCFIQNFNRIEQLRVLGLINGKITDMAPLGCKILIG